MNNRNNNNSVRAVSSSAQFPIIYDIPFSSIVEAYDDCIKKKKSSTDYLDFVPRAPQELVRLWNEMRTATYSPGTSKAFVVTYPVYREVFAANFADRVVHHWWALRVNPLFEKRFIAQGDVSLNCRKGRGVDAARRRAHEMMKQHPDWWVGRFDFEGFFMRINKDILYEALEQFIRDEYKGEDIEAVLFVTRALIFHSPQKDCIRRSPMRLWDNVPKRKSLFCQDDNRGCAIGNYHSQLVANFIASIFDDWILNVCGMQNYVRFVDDFLILAPTRADLTALIPKMRKYLKEQLDISLHRKKIYIQPVRHGALFVGTMIYHNRVYISNRTRGRMYSCIMKYNRLEDKENNIEHFVQSLNSYLGLMIRCKSYNIRKSVMYMIDKEWWKYVSYDGKFRKFIIKYRYKPKVRQIETVRSGEYKKILTPEI